MSDIEDRDGFKDDYTEFAEYAAKNFKQNPYQTSCGKLEDGEFFAMRYGADMDCVVVFKIEGKVVNFQKVIDLPPLEGMTHLKDLKNNQ